MKRILVSETGGALARNFISSLRAAKEQYYIIGVSSHPYEITLSNADESYLVPKAPDPDFLPVLAHIAKKTRAQFLHSQHDAVIQVLVNNKKSLNVPTFFPDRQTVHTCVDKFKSYAAWERASVPVAASMLVRTPADLKKAFGRFGPKIWIRLREGGGGAGSLPVSDLAFATIWIDHFRGWGKFMASEMLSPDSITWSSIWQHGELVVAQTRKRLYWLMGNRSLSGVTGVTGAAVTVRDGKVDAFARRAIFAIDPTPHGIFSVDMTYDTRGQLRATEINIGRFFTTIHFFTRAGLNMPELFVRLAFGERVPKLTRRVNPLAPGLVWVRGMDTTPVLTTTPIIAKYQQELARIKKNI